MVFLRLVKLGHWFNLCMDLSSRCCPQTIQIFLCNHFLFLVRVKYNWPILTTTRWRRWVHVTKFYQQVFKRNYLGIEFHQDALGIIHHASVRWVGFVPPSVADHTPRHTVKGEITRLRPPKSSKANYEHLIAGLGWFGRNWWTGAAAVLQKIHDVLARQVFLWSCGAWFWWYPLVLQHVPVGKNLLCASSSC